MKKRRTHFSIVKIWEDSDLKELLIEADNGFFSGKTRVYTGNESILELSKKIKGFPHKIKEQAEHSLGETSTYGIAEFCWV